jgi:hypothetical protein
MLSQWESAWPLLTAARQVSRDTARCFETKIGEHVSAVLSAFSGKAHQASGQTSGRSDPNSAHSRHPRSVGYPRMVAYFCRGLSEACLTLPSLIARGAVGALII